MNSKKLDPEGNKAVPFFLSVRLDWGNWALAALSLSWPNQLLPILLEVSD